VYEDRMVRYVPRLYLPFGRVAIRLPLPMPDKWRRVRMMEFPHAVMYSFQSDQKGKFDSLTEEKPDYGCVVLPQPLKPTDLDRRQDGLPFRSFLSVPLMTRNQ